jgi:hypothetical protein
LAFFKAQYSLLCKYTHHPSRRTPAEGGESFMSSAFLKHNIANKKNDLDQQLNSIKQEYEKQYSELQKAIDQFGIPVDIKSREIKIENIYK